MRKSGWMLLGWIILLALTTTSCAVVMDFLRPAQATPTATETAAPTLTPRPTRTCTPTLTPTRPILYPTQQAPLPLMPELSYLPGPSADVNGYRLQLWLRQGTEFAVMGNIYTISRLGMEQVQLNDVLDEQVNLKDINGDGQLELIVQTYSGGAHCCFSTLVYQFEPELTQVLASLPSNCGGQFEDLRGDGVPEFITCDDRWAYRYCPFAMSPLPLIVLEYQPGRGYVNASPDYPEKYAESLQRYRGLLEGSALSQDAFDGTSKCAVLPQVLNYLYLGDAPTAWQVFDQYYLYPDAAEFRADIEQVMGEAYYP